jgi:ABC-type dipeptide/oligopeptide/nickel transport system permease component
MGNYSAPFPSHHGIGGIWDYGGFFVGVSIGTLAASRSGTLFDIGGRLFGIITYSLPPVWVGMVLQLILPVQLNWFPLGTRFPISIPLLLASRVFIPLIAC